MKNERNGQAYAVYLTNGLLYDRLHTLAAEYALPVEKLTDLAVGRLLRDVELVADTVDNWDSYDTVFIGYPIWWGIAAWPVDGFVEANDFTGKTVIPFCTSASSGLGESGELLAEMAGTGDWMEGQRFSSNVSEADVEEWIDSLSLS